MQIVAHRINTLEKLWLVPSQYGIEFDVREGPNEQIVVAHDAWEDGVGFFEFMDHCVANPHAFYIVNIKCEGIESRVLETLRYYGIQNYFLLDCSFPMIVRLSRDMEHRLAVRLSEYESIETVLAMQGQVEWVWIDVFTRIPVSEADCDRLRAAGFKLCLVSPELQGRWSDLVDYRNQIGHCMDMVCTKKPTAWLSVSARSAS